MMIFRSFFTLIPSFIPKMVLIIFSSFLYFAQKSYSIFDLKNFINAQRQLFSHDFEYYDQKLAIFNLIHLIAEKRINVESIQFKKICSQVRLFLPKDKIRYISKTNKQSSLIFKEKEAFISKIEYDFCAKYRNDEKIMRTIFGINEGISVKKDLKIIIEEVDEDPNFKDQETRKYFKEGGYGDMNNVVSNKLNSYFTTSNFILQPQLVYNESNKNNNNVCNTNNIAFAKMLSDAIMEKYGVNINPSQILSQNSAYPNQLNAFLLIDPNYNDKCHIKL